MVLITTSLSADLCILVLGLIGILYWLATKNFSYWRKKGIASLEPKPFFGNLQELVLGKTSMGELLGKFYLENTGKPYVGMFGFHRPILLVRSPEIIKSILVKDFNKFYDRTFSPTETHDPLFVKNLFGLNNPRWKPLRVKLTPTFTSGKMKMMYEFVNECGKEMCDLVEREVNNADSGVLEVREILARYTTDVIASVGFGLQGNALKDPNAEFRKILRKVVEFDFWKNLKSAAAFFAPQLLSSLHLRVWDREITEFSRRVVWQTVEHRERTGLTRKDFLDLLMQLKNKGRLDDDAPQSISNGYPKVDGAEAKNDLDGDDFVAQAFVFMAAGFETSSSTTTFALHELACHPDIQSRLRQEIRDTVRADGGRLTYDAMQTMPLMQQVVQETLRLHPIIPFLDRLAMEDYRLPDSNAVLEKGTTVMIPTFGIQRDPELFEEPNSFRPERFADGHKNVPAYSHMPFGEGPRNCIGMRMGLMQVKVGLAYFLDRFEVKPSKHTKVPLEYDPQSFLLASKGGTHLNVKSVPGSVL